MVILLILIPLFSVGLVLYVTNLFDFISTGTFNEILFIISTALTVVTSYVIAYKTVDLIKSNKLEFLNKKNSYLIIGNYFSTVLLFLLGISLLYQGILHINVGQIIIGVGCLLIFGYVTFMYFFYSEEHSFILKSIKDFNGDKELLFSYEDVELTYYTKDTKYILNQYYVIKYNKYTNFIKKIGR